MAGAIAPLVGSLVTAGASMYSQKKQMDAMKKKEKMAMQQSKMAEAQAKQEKKQAIKAGGEEAARKNRMLKAYQKPQQTLVGQGSDTYTLG